MAEGIPVLAAGGIGHGRQLTASLAMGAQGVWLGTVWLTGTTTFSSTGSWVPAGKALAVDRTVFSRHITDAIESNPNIEVVRELVADIPTDATDGQGGAPPQATGPTGPRLLLVEPDSMFGKLFKSLKKTREKLGSGLARLFGGGHGYLELTGEDLLTTGVAITAQPPGKRISSLHLLSGGEKALTAVAFVFSIFRLNPAPFCLLDEVDAPLDDANVDRFCTLMEKMAADTDTRFLVITHHPMTMARVDRLFGVPQPAKWHPEIEEPEVAMPQHAEVLKRWMDELG